MRNGYASDDRILDALYMLDGGIGGVVRMEMIHTCSMCCTHTVEVDHHS